MYKYGHWNKISSKKYTIRLLLTTDHVDMLLIYNCWNVEILLIYNSQKLHFQMHTFHEEKGVINAAYCRKAIEIQTLHNVLLLTILARSKLLIETPSLLSQLSCADSLSWPFLKYEEIPSRCVVIMSLCYGNIIIISLFTVHILGSRPLIGSCSGTHFWLYPSIKDTHLSKMKFSTAWIFLHYPRA